MLLIFETFELFSWFLLAEAECVMGYLSVFEVEVDYKLSFLVKQQPVAFLIWKYEFIRCYKLKNFEQKTLFMLNSTEHGISTAHENYNTEK